MKNSDPINIIHNENDSITGRLVSKERNSPNHEVNHHNREDPTIKINKTPKKSERINEEAINLIFDQNESGNKQEMDHRDHEQMNRSRSANHIEERKGADSFDDRDGLRPYRMNKKIDQTNKFKKIVSEEEISELPVDTNRKSRFTPKRRDTFLFDNLGMNGNYFNDPMSVFGKNHNQIVNYRRYNKTNVDKGKAFFKMRYIQDKFIELRAMNQQNYKIPLNAKPDEIKVSVSKSIDSSNVPWNVIIHEDKNAIKFNSLFLQKIEKAIFSFNLKKYEDSYSNLMGSGIIKNLEEFAEVLLVFKGFDKYILGEFLSKEKNPNKEFKVLKSFIRTIDFRNWKFLDSFRFLLSRLNLPKDAVLILGIIEQFSNVYYEDNKDYYKNSDSIYLLASTILALNTMFNRTDITNMRVIQKEDFIKMNKEVDPKILDQIYDELKMKKLDIVHDYNELIYRRMSFKTVPKENNQTPLNNEAQGDNNYNMSDSFSIYGENNSEDFLKILKSGQKFIKYGNYGKPHIRFVKLSDNEKKISWFNVSGCRLFQAEKFILVSEIKDVYIGSSASKIFEKYKIPFDYDQNCFSIASNRRSLDLRNDDVNICKKWFQAIKFLIKRSRSISELKSKNRLKDHLRRQEIVADIWKTEILPNWHDYRNYIITQSGGNLMENLKSFDKEKFYKKISSSNGTRILEDKNQSDFLYLWTLGVPEWLRKKIWPLVIGNQSGITENLFNFHLKRVEQINFAELGKILEEEKTNFKNLNNFNPSANLNTIRIKPKLHVTDDPILNEIINDIIKISQRFVGQIEINKILLNDFMTDLFKVVRVFTIFRPDVTYSKQMTYIAAVLLLNSENYYSAFINFVNFSVPSFIMKFLTRDENYIRIRHEFFEKLLKKYFPNVYKHFIRLDISTSLFFYAWIEYAFIKTFNYQTLLRIWDIYLLKGEVVLYEIGLCIIKVQEKDLMNIPLKDVLRNLKRFPQRMNKQELFDILQDMDISEDYKRLIYENNLAVEKGLLFQSFMIDWL